MPRAAKGASKETVAGSPKQPGKERQRKLRRVYPDCLRCRFLGTACAGSLLRCDVCTAAGVDCLRFPVSDNDVLFDTLPKNIRHQLAGIIPRRKFAKAWKHSPAGAEFLSGEVDKTLCTPECIDDLVENPARLRLAPELNSRVLGAPLAAALKACPEQEGDRMPLPSSELLSCISNTFARADAAGEHESYSEHMGGGSLLAFGVLLQEYSRHLM
ncbi:hypothetical protein H4R20_002255 [Coemansia guatemalensis]|uniref:Zn(2)-C6 fungal-type domain-containing protein n=1 Tax=Coemansia guatemalensis TaxID=2761395 RepID=A0A9W8HXY9_9FUNG|nr:hypothetical protein H4R20_002255 [Coemansia guatemalensis]